MYIYFSGNNFSKASLTPIRILSIHWSRHDSASNASPTPRNPGISLVRILWLLCKSSKSQASHWSGYCGNYANMIFLVRVQLQLYSREGAIYLTPSTTDPKCYIFLDSLGPNLDPPTFRSPSGQNGQVTRNAGSEVSHLAICLSIAAREG